MWFICCRFSIWLKASDLAEVPRLNLHGCQAAKGLDRPLITRRHSFGIASRAEQCRRRRSICMFLPAMNEGREICGNPGANITGFL